jgi:hypothetical protein
MPRCIKCGKKGLFLKIEGETGLCLACNEDFAKEGKILTQKIIEAKNKVATENDKKEIIRCCQSIEDDGKKLIALHQTYNLNPSHELMDLVKTYQKVSEMVGK